MTTAVAMPRRGYDRVQQCAHVENGKRCRDVHRTNYEYKRDYTEAVRRNAGKPYLCLRHAHPEQVLSVYNTQVTSEPSEERNGHLYWNSNGFVYGPGFRAWAEDFPAGTRLVLTALLPEDYVPPPAPEPPPPPKPAWMADAIDLDK